MSFRYFSLRLYKHGRYFLQKYITRKINVNISEGSVSKTRSPVLTTYNVSDLQALLRDCSLRNVSLNLGFHAKKLLLENLPKISKDRLCPELKQFKKRLFFGNGFTWFSLVGVSFAERGLMSKEDESEKICWNIRNAVSKFQWSLLLNDENENVTLNQSFSLNDLNIGEPIGTGCSASVYEVKLVEKSVSESLMKSNPENTEFKNDTSEYPLALKVLYNYGIQSNSLLIYKGMLHEAVPARNNIKINDLSNFNDLMFSENIINLPPHPNIVSIYQAFVDYMPHLKESMNLFPDALPTRFNPEGSGRNMTLFLLMRRYKNSLKNYLTEKNPNQRECVLLFTQLLEAVIHMNVNGIAHRDLKNDNLLIDDVKIDENLTVPLLVVTDFGNCLADKVNRLRLPFQSSEISIGGNAALTAPEIILQKPGLFSILNYTKSDLWSAATIAYEIFGGRNPFFYVKSMGAGSPLFSFKYFENKLPNMNEKTPKLIERLVKNLLQRNPKSRLQAEIAANVCQLYLWAPSLWIDSGYMPRSEEISEWLLCLMTNVICEGRLFDSGSCPQKDKQSRKRANPEYILKSNFLCRVRFSQIKQAMCWIHANV